MRSTGLFLALAVTFVAVASAATPPERLNYQGVLRGADGTPIDGAQDMVFRFWTDATAGVEVLVDRHLAAESGAVSVEAGLFSVPIGSGTVVDGAGPGTYTSLTEMFAAHPELHMEIEIDGETLAPRVRVESAAYAMNSATIEGKSAADLEADTAAMIGAHQSDAAAHHGRYTDGEAVTAVGNSSLVPPGQCTGADQVLRWDGSGWSCEMLPGGGGVGPAAGNANGFEVIDDFGAGWDGLQRDYATLADADAVCTSLGGRLPRLSELWRVNSDDGPDSLVDAPVTDYLWTSIPATFYPGEQRLLRLDLGAVSRGPSTNLARYRCVWPASETDGFGDEDCFGNPEQPCRPLGLWHRVDDDPRMLADTIFGGTQPIDYPTSVHECLQSQGAMLDLRGALRYSREGGMSPEVWVTNVARPTQGDYAAVYVGGVAWALPGDYALPDTDYFLTAYCVGRAPGTPDIAPAAPACQGGCYEPALGGSTLIADMASRTAADHATAVAQCGVSGGRLPRIGEVSRLLFDGWPDGNGVPHWTADPAWDTGPVITTFQWTGDGDAYWSPINVDASPATASLPYRCVWPGRVEATATVCAPDEDQHWNGASFGCVPGTNGSSSDQAVSSEFVDAWGNAWDADVRSYGVHADAVLACSAVGGRLPTATELYRVRHANGIAPALGDATATELLWTAAPTVVAGTVSAMRLSDGIVVTEENNNENAYRCIWPASKGNALSGRSCHADPSESCFQDGPLRIDRLDRPAMTYAGAAFECASDGGQLPVLDELQTLIHAGAPNGSGTPLWTEHPAVDGTAKRYLAAGWSGTGTSTWSFQTPNAAVLDPGSDSAPFRCVFSTTHDY